MASAAAEPALRPPAELLPCETAVPDGWAPVDVWLPEPLPDPLLEDPWLSEGFELVLASTLAGSVPFGLTSKVPEV